MLVCSVSAVLLASACATQANGDDPRNEYVLAAGSNRMSYVVTQYMDASQLAQQQGLRLRYTTSGTASNTNLMAGLLSGEYDFVAPGAQTAVDAVSKGAPVQVVAGIAGSTNVLIMRNDVAPQLPVGGDASPAQRVTALRGLRIGTAPPGSSTYDRLRAVLSTSGVDPDKDVTMLGVTDASALAAGLRSDLYDAVWVAIGDSEPLIADGTARLWLSFPKGDFEELNEKSLVVVATTQTIQQHPDVVRQLRAALAGSSAAIRSDPDTAGQLLKKEWYAGMDQAAFDIGWDQGKQVPPPNIDFTREDFERSLAVINQSGARTDAGVDYDALVWAEARGGE